ncbi:ABC transporter permease subunit [Listeria seeligeri]|uniref:ABC transporter permease n=1 Tax=Listeria seeligeri TaxID=1640 RepID=UPI001624782C|nr:ABC transporter permease subunit [Listeria seeligeri]MBC1580091.1 ABC transporter permease subunit [Listeria seeligeri]MBC1596054.1 ABC transporter permease subunit [Listeria seeligeri]MBC1598960.1 ABC transporter permease subunit [Listeria seeligeri]MBC2044663.1 ABC transporter permease subunit [Listeria seeligeri]MBC2050759.1 ABC transporter permease subunit [Listeria seeligeri]
MTHFSALLGKEWLEQRRSLKIIWLPIVFALLGLTQPMMMYFLPDILNAFGTGSETDQVIALMGNQSAQEIMAQTLSSQFDQIGIIIIVVAAMACIQSDRTRGMLAFIMTRPVTTVEYVLSKWVMQCLVGLGSLIIGYILASYYTYFLFGKIDITTLIESFLAYALWFIFVISLVVFASAAFDSNAIVAMISVFMAILLGIISGFGGVLQIFNPAYLSKNAATFIMTGNGMDYFVATIFITIVWIILLLILTMLMVKIRPLQKTE